MSSIQTTSPSAGAGLTPFDPIVPVVSVGAPLAAAQGAVDITAYLASGQGQAPLLARPRGQLTPAQMMLVMQKLMGLTTEAMLDAMKQQVDDLKDAARIQLQEHLKKFNEMLENQAKERASRSRGGILGWIQKVATAVICVVVLVAAGAATGGGAVAPCIMALVAMGATVGALADLGLSIAGRKSLGEEMGSDWGAALLTCNLGALLAIGAGELGLSEDWQIAAAVLGTVIMAAAMAKFGSTAQTQAHVMKLLGRTTDFTMRFSMVANGVTDLGQGFEAQTQARLQKGISDLQAGIVSDQSEVTANQEKTEKAIDIVRTTHEWMSRFFQDAVAVLSQEFRGLRVLTDTTPQRHAQA